MVGGYDTCTGHPVMIVVVVVVVIPAQAVIFREEDVEKKICSLAFIFKSHRNNEMIEWFAIYFL
jgi:hypothetical protein